MLTPRCSLRPRVQALLASCSVLASMHCAPIEDGVAPSPSDHVDGGGGGGIEPATAGVGGGNTTPGGEGGAATTGSGGTAGGEPGDDTRLEVDFENRSLDQPYTVAHIIDDFAYGKECTNPSATPCEGLVRPGTDGSTHFSWPDTYEGKTLAKVVTDPTDPTNKVLQMLLPEGKKVHPRNMFNVRWEDGLRTARLEFDIYIDGDIEYPTKLPRLRGFRPGYIYLHEDPDPDGVGGAPTWGFANAPALDGDRLYLYHYWADQTNDCVGNSHFPKPNHRLTPGAWHHVELITHLNSLDGNVGRDDGAYEVYVDGTLAWVTKGLRLRDTQDLAVNTFSFLSWNNGKGGSALDSDVRVYYDNFLVVAHDAAPSSEDSYAFGQRTGSVPASALDDCPGHHIKP
ncbi:MAG: hypothetical protein AAGN82_01960 [Myxococcota bacterium]